MVGEAIITTIMISLFTENIPSYITYKTYKNLEIYSVKYSCIPSELRQSTEGPGSQQQSYKV